METKMDSSVIIRLLLPGWAIGRSVGVFECEIEESKHDVRR